MNKIDKYVGALKAVFDGARHKHEAHSKSAEIIGDMSADVELLTEVLHRHIEKSGSFNTLHYPVVGLEIGINEHFGLVANCWIPLPDRSTDVSTKAIHHHGDMLLTTATAFGTGYEHWTFERPCVVDAEGEIYELKLLERGPHPLHHVAFVDAYIAHLPLYPPDLTITYALWSSRFATTWKDKLKRLPYLQRNSERLRTLAAKAGLAKQLDLKVVEYFDFYPTAEGFRGIRERKEFERSNNEDYLASLFHIIQVTGNDRLVPVIRKKLHSGEKIIKRALAEAYLSELASGRPIQPRLSEGHFGIARANFSTEEILKALEVQNHARQAVTRGA